MDRKMIMLTLAVLFVIIGLFVASPLMAHEKHGSKDLSDPIKYGGQLYDNWPKLMKADLNADHPLYPAASKISGPTTWRCKECHGWDYIGKKGKYSKGSHFTGIDGIVGAGKKELSEIAGILSGDMEGHDLSQFMEKDEINALAMFIRNGLVEINSAVGGKGEGLGDAVNGKLLFEAQCASCHATDGNSIDFKGKNDGVQGVGWYANKNPQETLHKIRWGHPGSYMPSMVSDNGMSFKQTVDILTYSQTLD